MHLDDDIVDEEVGGGRQGGAQDLRNGRGLADDEADLAEDTATLQATPAVSPQSQTQNHHNDVCYSWKNIATIMSHPVKQALVSITTMALTGRLWTHKHGPQEHIENSLQAPHPSQENELS